MRRLLILVLTAALAHLAAAIEPALAQGDWSVKRDPFDEKVIARYKRILDRNPGDKAALRNLIRLYQRHRTVDKLVREYEAGLKNRPDDFSALVILGHIHMAQGATDQALAYYERGAALRPTSPEVQTALGDLYRRAGKIDEARSAYDLALASTKSKAQQKVILRALADLALGKRDVEGARSYFDRYIALEPDNVQARIELGDALVQHGQHKAAIEVFAKAEARLRSDPARHVEVISRMGAAHEAAGDEEAAVREYRRAMARVGREYYLRKELTARIIEIHRRRQGLSDLLAQYEKEWPAGRRAHFEWDVLARLYEETGNQEKAIDAYRKATQKAPHELDTQRRLIALLETGGREDEALAQYEKVIKVAPGEPRFQLELAERYWRRGKEKQALALLAQMERRFPGDPGVHSAIADLYTRWGKGDAALDAYERLTRIEPGDVTHLVNLGEQYFQRNQKNKAVAVWKKIITNKSPQNHARLGEVYAEHDMLQEALAMYGKAIKDDPKNPEHYKGRAGVHERRRSFDKAVEDWEKVLEFTPSKNADKPARREARRRVVNLLKRGQGNQLYRRALEWERAFAKTPPDVEAGYFLVEAHVRERQYTKARQVLERLLSIDGDDLEAMDELVKVYKRELDYDKAVALLERLATLSPARQREYYNEIAEIKTAQRHDDEAIEWITRAVDSSPNDPLAHQRLAERYAEMQQFDKAIGAYEKALELDQRNFRAYFALAQLYKYNNAALKAAELYREVLRRATDEEILRKAGREAIALEEMTGTLGDLERVLVPLAFTFGHKPIYRYILVDLYDRYVPHLVGRWRAGETAARKELDRLGAHGLKPLLEALSDEKDVSQQRIAVDVLGYLGNKGAAAPLVRLAQKESEPGGSQRRAIGTLMQVVDWEMRVKALVAAGRLGDARTIDSLIALSKHPEKTMREAALFALGRTGHRDAIPPLLATLDQGNSIQTLGCLGLAQIPAARSETRVTAQLIATVKDRRNSDIARAACAFALGYMGERQAAPALIEILEHGNDETQRLAAWALGRLDDKRAVPALLSAYFSRHDRVREAVAWALARVTRGGSGSQQRTAADLGEYPMKRTKYDAEAVLAGLPGPLEDAWPSPDVLVGHQSDLAAGLREALSRHRDLVVRVLRDLDSDPDRFSLGPLTREISALPKARQDKVSQTLEQIARSIIPELAQLAQHRDPGVRGLALSVVSKIDTPETAKLLVAGMNDPRPAVRLAAMKATATYVRLHDKHGKELSSKVAARLREESWQGRTDAAQTLGSFGKYADEAALVQALGDDNAYVRQQAAVALGKLSRTSSVEALISATSDEVASVRLAAVESLGIIGGERARKRLAEVAGTDRDAAVAETARKLLGGTKN
jgi:cellulose synthase operon protein C